MLVADFVAQGLPYKERLALFRNVVLATMDTAAPVAIHWRLSQRFVCPGEFRATMEADQPDASYPAINVRLFNVANRDGGETVMDRVGLAAFGLCDVQCQFRDLDVNEVARVLFDSGYYIFERGDVIQDGHTI